MDFDGYDVDDVLADNQRRKKKNSKHKGKRGELALVKLFNERFQTHTFSRVVGSGNRWAQIECVTRDYIGDIVCPPGFRFTIECKNGYNDIDLYAATQGPVAALDEFLSQAEEDARRSGKEPLVCWKKDRHPWLGFVKRTLVKKRFDYQLRYRDWLGTGLLPLFALPNSFFITDV